MMILSFKKSVRGVALLLLTAVSTIVQGQNDSLVREYQSPCQSEWTKYNNLTEWESIVRSNNQNHVTYIHEKTISGLGRHIFVVRGNNMTPVAAFSAVFVDCCPGCLCSTISISDMRLFDGTCYFCGKVVTPKLNLNGEHITMGFVGRFIINDMLYGYGSVYYQTFSETTQLTRLAISKTDETPVLISAIGTEKTKKVACILELEDTGSTWIKRIDTISGRPEIVFSDIMTFKDSITLLAQYTCGNDNLPESYDYDINHQIFLLDRFDLDGCNHTYNPISSHNMFRYNMFSNENYFFHYNNAPMRLFHINDSYNMVGVAFGVEKWDGSMGGIRLFLFHNAQQYSNSLFYQTGLHAVIKEIGNLYNTNKLFVLSTDNTHTNGLITIPVQSGSSHIVTWLTNGSYTYNSLTQKIFGAHIDISGHDNSFGFHLFDQNINQLSLPSCFDVTNNQYEVIPGRHANPLEITWKYGKKVIFEWEKSETNTIDIDLDIICNNCNERFR
ncbi:MAG: hypothetical protein IKG81_05100 [Bacteroidales bacterium]|nr:hypothetical protein [Bacteroidales bacterium]